MNIVYEIEEGCLQIIRRDNTEHIIHMCRIVNELDGENCLILFVNYVLHNKVHIANRIMATAKSYSLGRYEYGAYFNDYYINPCIVVKDTFNNIYPIIVCILDDDGKFITIDDITDI